MPTSSLSLREGEAIKHNPQHPGSSVSTGSCIAHKPALLSLQLMAESLGKEMWSLAVGNQAELVAQGIGSYIG